MMKFTLKIEHQNETYEVVRRMRAEIEHESSHFAKLKNYYCNGNEVIETDTLILAVGHSARDTYEMIYEKDFR